MDEWSNWANWANEANIAVEMEDLMAANSMWNMQNLDAPEEHDLESAFEELETLIAGMDPDSLHQVIELLDVNKNIRNRWAHLQNVLGLARSLATKWFHAPEMPTTDKTALAPLSDGYDVDGQDNYAKIVTVLVGSGKQQVKFTAIAGALAAQAKFFKPLCDDRWMCSLDGVIELEVHQPESFKIFIAWLYTRDIKIAECLVKIEPVAQGKTNVYFRKQSHKTRWFQLLHCYFLADYIGAPQFANCIMDALVFAYKAWVETDFTKVDVDPIFDDKKTEELVEINTVESSPLRAMIRDILAPYSAMRSAKPTLDQRLRRIFTPHYSSRNHQVRKHTTTFPFLLPLSQNDSPSNQTNALQASHVPLHPFLGHPPPLSIPNHPPLPAFANHPPHHAFQNLPPPISPPQLHPHAPQPFHQPNPRRSRLFGLRRCSDLDLTNVKLDRPENSKKIWEEHRCKYHIHEKSKDCCDEK
ncbi:hypothetical protein SBOR_6483 [Sclerotinia borealis F-4128]|uniref:BTB domain-containing protein n=1 Tax=Sclerotinia borealis (strain F-4128) TaxID=1432307 RepID=W9CB82_SCLBF|nr:hypothetical protein SBOR_6483 [Sclerotinia borealis F-4128]